MVAVVMIFLIMYPIIITNLSRNPQLTQTIYQSTPKRNDDNDGNLLWESFHFSSNHLPLPMNEEKEEDKKLEESSFKNELSSSSENKALKFIGKGIETLGQDHITDLLIEKMRNKHYYLNYKNKKIMEPENFKGFREKNLTELSEKIKGIKIFKNIMRRYDMIKKIHKIDSIMMDKKKKNSHKVVEVSSELGKSTLKYYFAKKYFIEILGKSQKGIKNIQKIYKTSKIVKATKFIVRAGRIGIGIVITFIADEVIDGTCDLVCFGMDKIIDKFEDQK